MPFMISCWHRLAVEVGVREVARVVSRPREEQRLLAIQVMAAGVEVEREAAIGGAAGDLRADPRRRHRDAADVVDELREVGEVDDDQVVDLKPGQLLDHLQRERRTAVRPSRVDLLKPKPGMSTSVSRGIESRRETPPPIRHNMIESVFASASL